jgi:hypothetical protein
MRRRAGYARGWSCDARRNSGPRRCRSRRPGAHHRAWSGAPPPR